MNPIRRTRHLALLATAVAALALAACNRHDDRTAGQKLDSAIAKTEQKADQAKAEVKQEMNDAKVATDRATDQVSATVADATVTASINAELARDPKLSAMKIDVDTTNGRVLLSGTAPDSASRERASTLAYSVKGVTSVENRLQVVGG
ncbi:MAG: BON domain-containing protein [Burkholderiaceae bacterium]